MHTISPTNWQRLVEANRIGVENGWAAPGVFGTGIGPDYRPGGLLYVGKSAGPLSDAVGSCNDQLMSSQASTRWMIERRNRSAFWQFVDRLDPTRRSIAWTNICKMDVKGGGKPPSGKAWLDIKDACIAALREEIAELAPRVTVFAISGAYRREVKAMLVSLGYAPFPAPINNDGWTAIYRGDKGQVAVTTRHPQGWPNSDRDQVINLVRSMLSPTPTYQAIPAPVVSKEFAIRRPL